jgi:hypothetical protein
LNCRSIAELQQVSFVNGLAERPVNWLTRASDDLRLRGNTESSRGRSSGVNITPVC